MAKRQLSDEEKSLNHKAIERMKERNRIIEKYFIPKYKLEIEFGVPLTLEDMQRKYNDSIKDWESELKSNKLQIDILAKQNNEGVDIKEIKEMKGGTNGIKTRKKL